MNLKEEIWEITSKSLNKEDLFIVDIEISGTEGHKKIKVVVDGDRGVGIDDCAGISRRVGHVLEETNLIDAAYLLEVTSPGVDQPLKLKRQYQKNVGRKLSVTLKDDKIVIGKLEEVKDESIIINSEIKQKNKKALDIIPVEIAFTEIKKSNVLVSFK